MKKPNHEAARSLDLHPANLLLHLSTFGMEFDDIWPVVDISWIDTLRQSDYARFGHDVSIAASRGKSVPAEEHVDLGVTDDMAIVIEKLWRKKKWGKLSVSFNSLRHLTQLSTPELESAVLELSKLDLLACHGRHGAGEPYSLNTGQSAEIDRIASRMVSGG